MVGRKYAAGAQSFAGTLTSAFAWTGVIATFHQQARAKEVIERGRCAGRSHNHAFANSLRAIATLTLVLSGTIGTGRVAAASTSAPAVQTVRATALSEGKGSSARRLQPSARRHSRRRPRTSWWSSRRTKATATSSAARARPTSTAWRNTYSSATKWYAVQHNSPHDYRDLIVGQALQLGLPDGQAHTNTTLVDELHRLEAFLKGATTPSNCFHGHDEQRPVRPESQSISLLQELHRFLGLVQ